MSNIDRWKKIFSYSKNKSVPVRVGEKIEDMTQTQAGRYGDLTEGTPSDSQADSDTESTESTQSTESDESSYKLADEDNPLIEKKE